MIIVACGMNRSGSTLHFQIIKRITEIHGGLVVVEPDERRLEEKLIKLCSNKKNLIALKSHGCGRTIGNLLSSGEAIGFYTHRDPLDACASLMRMHDWSFEQLYCNRLLDIMEQNYYGYKIYFDNSVIKRSYHKFYKSVADEAEYIAKRIGLHLDRSEALRIETDLSLDKQSKRIAAISAGQSDAIEYGPYKIDRKEQLLNCHITSNGNDSWQNSFSLIEQHLIAARVKTLRLELGYTNRPNSLSLPQLGRYFLRSRDLKAALKKRRKTYN